MKNPFKKEPKSHPAKLEEGHVIVPAFHDGQEQCYMLKDMFNSFCARAMDALALYEQWGMRCTADFLKLHTQAVDAILRDPKKINVMDIGELNNKLKERLEFAIPTEEIIYKFASVAYFDKHESPYKYDNKYGEEKIKRWKQNKEIDGFFLHNHIENILPLPNFSRQDFSLLLTTISKIDSKHLDLITGILSSSPQSKDLLTRLRSEKNLESTPSN